MQSPEKLPQSDSNQRIPDGSGASFILYLAFGAFIVIMIALFHEEIYDLFSPIFQAFNKDNGVGG